MTIAILLLNLIVLGVALESDVGRRKVGPFRVFRPLITALVIVPFFFQGMSLSGNGLILEIGATAVGLALGLAALAPMKFEYDADEHRVYSRAGLVYVAGWVAITALKLFFSYGSTDIWGRQLFAWMNENGIGVDAFRAAFIFLNVATMVARVGAIYFRGSATARAAGAPQHMFRKVRNSQNA